MKVYKSQGDNTAGDQPNSHKRGDHQALDAVGVYLHDLQSCKRLSREEEVALTRLYHSGLRAKKRIRNGDSNTCLSDVLQQGREAARNLIESHLPLVVAVAKRFYARHPHHVAFADLICAGNEGLLVALDRFDPRRGYRFGTYAIWWIRNKMSAETRQATWPIHISDQAYRDYLRLLRIIRSLTEQRGRYPTWGEIADASGWSPDKVGWLFALAAGDIVSLYTPLSDDGSFTVADLIGNGQEPITAYDSDVAVGRSKQDRRDVAEAIENSLTPRERKVVSLRFGLEDGVSRTLDEVGKFLNLSGERIRQIESKALRVLRSRLAEERVAL